MNDTTITPAAALVASLRSQVATRKFVEADDIAHFGAARTRLDDSIALRILIERAIIRRAVKDLIAAGLVVSVYDGEEYPVKRSSDVGAVMAEIGACDEEWLIVRNKGTITEKGSRVGQIYLVYGNDGWDVMADYHVCLEQYLAGANDLADAICDALAEVF